MKEAASATALLVASGVAYRSTHPRHGHLVPSDAAELSRRFVRAAGARVRSGSSWLDRLVVAVQERLTVPGITLHYVLRKRRIEALTRRALADGFDRLIVLGAGLDTLAIRLSGEVKAIEIDHPATQRLKREVAADPVNVDFVPVDLTRDTLSQSLPDNNAVVVAEAVFLYLSEEEVRRILRQLGGRHRQTRLIFTFFAPRRRRVINFQNATWLADLWLSWKGEPARWAIAPEDVGRFLSQEGFTLRELVRDTDFHEGYSAARGEHIAVADVNAPRRAASDSPAAAGS